MKPVHMLVLLAIALYASGLYLWLNWAPVAVIVAAIGVTALIVLGDFEAPEEVNTDG